MIHDKMSYPQINLFVCIQNRYPFQPLNTARFHDVSILLANLPKNRTVLDLAHSLYRVGVCDSRMNAAVNGHKRPRGYSKHGLMTLKQTVKGLGGRVIDRRTTLGKALHKWRCDLIADLGGQDNISTQQSALVDLAVKSKLLLDSIDAWLLTQDTLINKRKKTLLPVVLQRQTLTDGLARYLS